MSPPLRYRNSTSQKSDNLAHISAGGAVIESVTSAHVLIGVPMGLLLAVLVGYAVYFLQRHRHKPANKLLPPPPPSRPPPALPPSQAAQSSHRYTHSPHAYSAEQRYLMSQSSANAPLTQQVCYTRSPGVHSGLSSSAYHQLEPSSNCTAPRPPAHRGLPLYHNGGQSRGIYEATPLPPPSAWDTDDGEGDDPTDGHLQPYPSLYSCT